MNYLIRSSLLLTHLISVGVRARYGISASINDSYGQEIGFVTFGGKIRFHCHCPPENKVSGILTPNGQLLPGIMADGNFSEILIVNSSFPLGVYKCQCENFQLTRNASNFEFPLLYRTCDVNESIKYRRNCVSKSNWNICVKTVENVGSNVDSCFKLTTEICRATHQKQVIRNSLCFNGTIYGTICEAYAIHQGKDWENAVTYLIEKRKNYRDHCRSSMDTQSFIPVVYVLNSSAVPSELQEGQTCDQFRGTPGALKRLEFGTIWRSLQGYLLICFYCGNVTRQATISRKFARSNELPDNRSKTCDPRGYITHYLIIETVTSSVIIIQFNTSDGTAIEKQFRVVSTDLQVNLVPDNRCGRIRQLTCKYEVHYDKIDFQSKISWAFNGKQIKMSSVKIYRDYYSQLNVHHPGNYACMVDTLFNMAETYHQIIHDRIFAIVSLNKTCLAPAVLSSESGIILHVIIAFTIVMAALAIVLIVNLLYQKNIIGGGPKSKKRQTMSTPKTASISPRSVNTDATKSPPISTKSKSKS